MLFGDEAAGGYGYWLGEADMSDATDEERSVQHLDHGSFRRELALHAKRILDDICNMRPEPDLEILHLKLKALESR